MLVPAGQVASAAALTGVVLLLGMTAGSALGAGLVATAGPAVAFAVNAASFGFDVVLLATIRAGASPRIAPAPRQMCEGLAYVWRTPRPRRIAGQAHELAALKAAAPLRNAAGSAGLTNQRVLFLVQVLGEVVDRVHYGRTIRGHGSHRGDNRRSVR